MKITLDGLDGRNFTLRIPRDGGGEHVVALHDARALRGAYEHDAARFSLAPVEADALVGAIAWALSDGAVELAGPLTLGATRVALEIRRDDRAPGVTGDVRCASLEAPTLRVSLTALAAGGSLSLRGLSARHDVAADAWAAAADALATRGLSVARGALRLSIEALDAGPVAAHHGGGATDASLATVTVTGLRATVGEVVDEAARATLTGLRVRRTPEGLGVEVDAAELAGVAVARGQQRVEAPALQVTALKYGPGGASFERLAAEELRVSVAGLGERGAEPAEAAPAAEAKADGPQTLGVDLPFLDAVAGLLEADTEVDVKVPWIGRRVATHRLRLSIDEGAFAFKQLEHGLSKLEDAVLDFEVDDQGLYFEVDAVVWKRTLLRWPLDGDDLALAREGRVRLRTFARPRVEAASSSKPAAASEEAADPRFALRRVSIDGIRVELAIGGSSTLPLAGGTLRLGHAGAPALGALRLGGSLSLDTTRPADDATLSLDLEALDAGADGIALGARRIDVARARLGRITDGRITLRGVAPASVAGTLGALSVDGFTLAEADPARA